MARILTGIQSSGKPHLGNILGAIEPSVELSKNSGNESLFFIADLHSLINIKDSKLRHENTLSVAAAWISMGFDYKNNFFYRQSKITEVCELTWYLNCFTPFPMLSNSHSFKDKSHHLSDVNAGLFTYPVLMAADIILYNANTVPVVAQGAVSQASNLQEWQSSDGVAVLQAADNGEISSKNLQIGSM